MYDEPKSEIKDDQGKIYDNDEFFTALENILYRLDTTLGELNLSPDELYAYSKQYEFNRDELEEFMTETRNMMKEDDNTTICYCGVSN